jgi:hypothetical protein
MADGRTATLLETPVHSSGLYSVRHANRNNQCEISSSQLLAGTTLVGSVHSAELSKGAAHNIVLVHGASWQPVADILTKKGYNVTLVENPLTSLAADVDATKRALEKQDGRTVLVGHPGAAW